MTRQMPLPTRGNAGCSSDRSAVRTCAVGAIAGHRSRRRENASLSLWDRPTVGEFIRRAEHQFGTSGDQVSRLLAGYRRSERLASNDVRELCDRLGLPATDFGVDP